MKTKAARALMLASAEMVDNEIPYPDPRPSPNPSYISPISRLYLVLHQVDNEIVRMRGEGKAAHSALNEMQPYVSRPATVCISPCNPMYPALQPYVSRPATLSRRRTARRR